MTEHIEHDSTTRELRISRKSSITPRIADIRNDYKPDEPATEIPELSLCDWHKDLDLVFVQIEEGLWYMAAYYSNVGELPVTEGLMSVEEERFGKVLFWRESGKGYGITALLDVAGHTRFTIEDGVGSTHLWEKFDFELWEVAHGCS